MVPGVWVCGNLTNEGAGQTGVTFLIYCSFERNKTEFAARDFAKWEKIKEIHSEKIKTRTNYYGIPVWVIPHSNEMR